MKKRSPATRGAAPAPSHQRGAPLPGHAPRPAVDDPRAPWREAEIIRSPSHGDADRDLAYPGGEGSEA